MKTLKVYFLFSLMLLGANVYSQNTINGNVTDENGTPLPGATILNLETSQGSTSDFNGEF